MEEPTEAAISNIRRHIRILADIGKLCGGSFDIDHFLEAVVVQVARAVEIDHVKVLRYRPRFADLIVAAGMGWKEGVVKTATLATDLRSPPGRAYQTAEPVVIRNFTGQDEYDLSPMLREHGIVSLMNVPVLIDGAAWGVLEVDSTRSRHFNQDDVDFLTAAGAMVGAYIQRQQAREEESAKAARSADANRQDVLLREMQHRVKNNFQFILGAISLQRRRSDVEEVHHALDHLASRINAISLAHDQLASRQDGQSVKLSYYVEALCASLRQQSDAIEISVRVDELLLPIERAVSLGLILNESVTNSVKHAFSSEGGKISVSLAAGIGYGEARLTIVDNGHGMGGNRKSGSGLKLIESLARHLGATITRHSSASGTEVAVTFPVL